MVSFLVAACVATLKEFPDFNSSLDGDELVLRRYFNIGFAADTPGGLVVPVIKQADRKGLAEIARELTELSGRAREGKLGPADMAGGTFTISSLGGIGGTSFTPIINAPEVAILGVTRAAVKPVWDEAEGEFVPRLMVPLSLSYDHRVIDGASAARFVAHLVKVLERSAQGAAVSAVEVAVPDIGEFADVPVIEVLVAAGDTVAVEDPLVTLESDKATMDVPSPSAGTVKELRVKVGDKVSQGSVILTLEAEGRPQPRGRLASPPAEAVQVPTPGGSPQLASQPPAAAESGPGSHVVVIGSGPGRLHRRVPGRRSRAEGRR